MQFRSTKAHEPLVSFKDAVLRCLPQNGGLYVPAAVMDLRQFFLYMNSSTTYPELVATVAPALLQGELNPFSASRVAESAFAFEPELIQLDENFSLLNLCNGPTGVFKDFGIAFLAAVMEELLKNNGAAMVVSAVRGDTGVSIAHAFNKRKNLTSVMLYPSGPIFGLDRAAFVPRGGDIIPVQIKGTFDDCQRLVTEIIRDRPFSERYNITSANTINPGRLLAQVLYYLYAFIKIKQTLQGEMIYSVPCGNFGNLIAGLYAWKFGMPVNGFIAAMNRNNTFDGFIKGKKFTPHLLQSTISPALDVGMPSNSERLLSFYEEAPAVMKNMIFPISIDDRATQIAMEKVWKKYGIIIDPHSAVAFAAAEQLSASRDFSGHVHIVVLCTGHPAKSADTIANTIGQRVKIPERLNIFHKGVDPLAVIEPQLDSLEGAIASCI
ncbi:MAG: threonine synthase [Treponema sp.]|jgi:threonine synthase|nr:threonine synthase [Treponema sp.]